MEPLLEGLLRSLGGSKKSASEGIRMKISTPRRLLGSHLFQKTPFSKLQFHECPMFVFLAISYHVYRRGQTATTNVQNGLVFFFLFSYLKSLNFKRSPGEKFRKRVEKSVKKCRDDFAL